MLQASGPGKNTGNGVGAGRISLKEEWRITLKCLTSSQHVGLNNQKCKAQCIYFASQFPPHDGRITPHSIQSSCKVIVWLHTFSMSVFRVNVFLYRAEEDQNG